MRRTLITLALGLLLTHSNGQEIRKEVESPKMEWFDDAKLGIFIHWGIYSVDGISESWAFFNNYLSHENYMKQLQGFTADKYDPKEWVQLIKDSGAKYSVITTKHHDGVSLWDSKMDQPTTIAKDAAAKKDVLTPFVQELKASGLKTGLYFSLPDWSHPNYDIITRTQKRYDIKEDPNRWTKFQDYYQGQLKELSVAYKPDLIWFDGDWEHSSEEWKAKETLDLLRKYNKNIIINSRLNNHGDYATPEQGIPVRRPDHRYWELCYTMNDSWGYQHFDKHYKSPNMIVRTLIECLAMGGNLLLDIGPKADGTIPEEQVAILKELARWTKKYSEAIYGTRAGLSQDLLNEKNSFSKDGKTIFIYLDQVKDYVEMQGLDDEPLEIKMLGTNDNVPFEYQFGKLKLQIPTANFDPVASVVAVKFNKKPSINPHILPEPVGITDFLYAKTPQESIRKIVDMTSVGANLFKGYINDDGSKLDQSFNFHSDETKNWVKKHAEVLQDAAKGIPANHFNGKTALSPDKQTLYLFVEGQPTGPIAIKGLKNNIARIRIVGEGSMIGHKIYNKLYWSATPGIVYIDIPKDRLDKNTTVIAVLLDKPIELFSEEVGAIESNL